MAEISTGFQRGWKFSAKENSNLRLRVSSSVEEIPTKLFLRFGFGKNYLYIINTIYYGINDTWIYIQIIIFIKLDSSNLSMDDIYIWMIQGYIIH